MARFHNATVCDAFPLRYDFIESPYVHEKSVVIADGIGLGSEIFLQNTFPVVLLGYL